MAKLGDVFNLQMGKTPARANLAYWTDGTNEWVSIADLSSYEKYVEGTKEKITDLAVQESGIKKISANTVIMSFKLSLGKTAITKTPVYTNEAIMAFLPSGKYDVCPDYFFYLFSGKDWSEGTNRAVMGATLNKATLRNIEIDVPPLDEQRRIAAILDKVTDLINKRRAQLDKLDLLVKSRFVEMFGDCKTNPKRWPVCKLDEIAEVGSSKRVFVEELQGGPYPLIQTGDVSNSDLYIVEYSSSYSELGFAQSRLWKAGTLCITIAANIAQTSILTFDCCFPDSVVGFIPGNETNAIFMHYWFSFFQKILEEQAPQVAQKNINLKILSNLDIIVPPSALQEQFAQFVNHVIKVKTSINSSLGKINLIKKALMTKYYRL